MVRSEKSKMAAKMADILSKMNVCLKMLLNMIFWGFWIQIVSDEIKYL